MSLYQSIKKLPDDPILGLTKAFLEDTRKQKYTLGVGAYKNEEGQPVVFDSVRKAEAMLLEQKLNKDYLPIQGNPDFIKRALELLYGVDYSKSIFGAQTLGGTGALRMGGEFLSQMGSKLIYVSNPTWGNHKHVFTRAGLTVKDYSYLDSKKTSIDFSSMCRAIESMEPKNVILLQACCHNPTGIDPTWEQWQELSALIKKQKLVPFFDIAYQGFKEDCETDASVVRFFAQEGHEFFVASSFSKNFGLYGERVGLLSFVTQNNKITDAVGSQLKPLIRGCYSMPPLHGGRIVSTILNSNALKANWTLELKSIRQRISQMRELLVKTLADKGYGDQFEFLKKQCGMFSFTGLLGDQVDRLKSDFGIYLPQNGRINVAGLNKSNIEYIVDSITQVL